MGIIAALIFGALLLGLYQKYDENCKARLKKEKKKKKKVVEVSAGEMAVMRDKMARMEAELDSYRRQPKQ